MKKSKIVSIPIWHAAKREKINEILNIKTGTGFGGKLAVAVEGGRVLAKWDSSAKVAKKSSFWHSDPIKKPYLCGVKSNKSRQR